MPTIDRLVRLVDVDAVVVACEDMSFVRIVVPAVRLAMRNVSRLSGDGNMSDAIDGVE